MSDEQYVYGLRTCNADMTAYNGFVWTREGPVEAPDWNPAPVCGGGLHFLRNGEGNAGLLSDKDDAVWMVVKADAAEIVDIDHAKSKARRCEVVFAGSREGAVSLLRTLVGPDKKIPFVSETAGDGSTQAAGDRSTQTAGEGSVFITRWWDEIESRYRVAVAIVGKDGTLKPNTPYRCENGVWAEVEPAAPEGGVA